jgi:hypothetical protein
VLFYQHVVGLDLWHGKTNELKDLALAV